MSMPLLKEIADVRAELQKLEKRIDEVEKRSTDIVAVPENDILTMQPGVSITRLEEVTIQSSTLASADVPPEPVIPNRSSIERTLAKSSSNPENLTIYQQQPVQPKEALEVFVGRHLNKLGISFLVIGCALALLYEFQVFSPALKVFCGLLAGALLIFGGVKVEQVNAKMSWYGRALVGGGWALTYFSVFAAHHFESVKLIGSALVDFVLLLAVAAGAIFHALKYKSETISAITLTLAFATICLSPATAYSVLACALLVAMLAWLSTRMNWFNLFLYGECVFYAVYIGFIVPQIMQGHNAIWGLSFADGNLLTAIGCSLFSWLAMTFVLYTPKQLTSSDQKRLAVSSVINCAAFISTVLTLLDSSHSEMKFGFLLSTGLAYLLASLNFNNAGISRFQSCNRVLGLSLLTMSVPLKLTGDWVAAFWALEIPVLMWAGMKYEIQSLRVLASFLAVIVAALSAQSLVSTSMDSVSRIALSSAAFTAFGITTWLYRRYSAKSNKLAFYVYFALAACFANALLGCTISGALLPVARVIVNAFIVLIGINLDEDKIRVSGETAMILTGLPILLTMDSVVTRFGILAIIPVLLYLAHKHPVQGDGHTFYQSMYKGVAAILTALRLAQLFTGLQLSFLLYLQTSAIFAYGFFKRDKAVRIVAWAMAATMTLKYAVIDFNIFDSWAQQPNTYLLSGLLLSTMLIIMSLMHVFVRFRKYRGAKPEISLYAYFALSTTVVAIVTSHFVPANLKSLALTVEGVWLLVLGFNYAEKPFRVSGLAVLALLVCRLLFVELANVDALYRVFSFIAAGGVLLLASFAYAKMSSIISAENRDQPMVEGNQTV